MKAVSFSGHLSRQTLAAAVFLGAISLIGCESWYENGVEARADAYFECVASGIFLGPQAKPSYATISIAVDKAMTSCEPHWGAYRDTLFEQIKSDDRSESLTEMDLAKFEADLKLKLRKEMISDLAISNAKK